MDRKYLYIVAAVIWGIPGIIISVKGIKAYLMQSPDALWWLLMITAAVMTGFFLCSAGLWTDTVTGLPGCLKSEDLAYISDSRGWILLVFMMGLGIALKHIPGVPTAFTASFYSGLGPMLLLSSVRFVSCLRLSI